MGNSLITITHFIIQLLVQPNSYSETLRRTARLQRGSLQYMFSTPPLSSRISWLAGTPNSLTRQSKITSERFLARKMLRLTEPVPASAKPVTLNFRLGLDLIASARKPRFTRSLLRSSQRSMWNVTRRGYRVTFSRVTSPCLFRAFSSSLIR